ncbi:MAG: B12-binding domain-containing radical SAM protein, partial [Deltaproteobacteria bacterium]
MRALLVNPEFPPTYWSYRYALGFVGKRCALPPLGLITVAALLPVHWRPRLVDLNVESLADGELRAADVVMLTA